MHNNMHVKRLEGAAGNAAYSVQRQKKALSGGRPKHAPKIASVAKSQLTQTFDTIL
jgi:hypothetical protein